MSVNEHNAEQLAGRDILLITDNDAAGRRAQGPIRAMLEAFARTVTVLATPDPTKDVNDLLLEGGRDLVRAWLEVGLHRVSRRLL
ncbi:toprim domain-containing protein [Deinococcus sp. MIMF12]|uniref:Toprim domain-containing protein n=1 Tax=Deinococcus rhizophilus TaxID=3049544 RepID=A0ABT7JDA6_9DEIO|nr:toprim domain-containing protein [Deinococcus rhizophilus]MDL2343012.1 toprim domain-containing protein [Deinococcus rhizophilus]